MDKNKVSTTEDRTIMYYVYRHIRKDNNKVFYIGMGSKTHKRAYEKCGRNRYWNNVVNKTEYFVEIVEETQSRDTAAELEEFLIETYGRGCYNEGTLTNIASGGEGAFGVKQSEAIKKWRSEKWKGDKNPMYGVKGENNHRFGIKRTDSVKKAISEANKGKTLTKEHREKLSKARMGKYTKGDSPSAKKVIDTETKEIYNSLIEASESTGFKYDTLKAMLQGRNPNKTKLEYYEQ